MSWIFIALGATFFLGAFVGTVLAAVLFAAQEQS